MDKEKEEEEEEEVGEEEEEKEIEDEKEEKESCCVFPVAFAFQPAGFNLLLPKVLGFMLLSTLNTVFLRLGIPSSIYVMMDCCLKSGCYKASLKAY